MGKTRVLGGLLAAACVAIIILHLYFGYMNTTYSTNELSLAFKLPITVGILAVGALGLWLGWIMLTTREVSPPPIMPQKKAEEPEKK